MIQIVAVLVVLLSGTVLVAHRSVRKGHGPTATAHAWMTTHHLTVAMVALTTVVAYLLPFDLVGRRGPSDLYGGYVGQYALLSFVWTIVLVPLTVVGRIVVRRAPPRAAVVTVAVVWALTVLGLLVVIAALAS